MDKAAVAGKVALLLGALALGMLGSAGVNAWQRHSAQHATVERMMLEQDRINREFAQAINALAQRK